MVAGRCRSWTCSPRAPAGAVISDGANEDLAGAPPIETCPRIIGSTGPNFIEGTSGCDWISAGYGHDLVDGVGTGDWIYGGPGVDDLYGGAGDDLVAAGCRGGTCPSGANDLLAGEGGNDVLGGDNGAFTILRGGDGTNDVCYYDAADDIGFGCEIKIKDGVRQ